MKRNGQIVILVALSVLLLTALACSFGGGSSPTPTQPLPTRPQPTETQANGKVTLTVTNNMTSASVCEVYVISPFADTWGNNMLVTSQIAGGSSFDIQLRAGVYNLRAVDCNQNSVGYEWDFELTTSDKWTLVDPVTLTLNNTSTLSACYVRISRPGSQTWGSNWLGTDVSIDSGSSYDLQVQPGTYDLKAEDCDKIEIAEQRGFDLSGSNAWTIPDTRSLKPGAGNPGTLTINNNMSDTSVCNVYIASPDAGSWGDNKLGSNNQIASGGTFDIQVNPGTYDLKVVDCNQNTLAMESSVDLTTAMDWTFVDPATLTITNNMTGKSLCYAYIASREANTWGSNWLNSDQGIASGSDAYIQVQPGGYDLRLKDCDQNVVAMEWSVDLTSSTSLTIVDSVTLTINNTSSKTVCYVRITRPSISSWGGN